MGVADDRITTISFGKERPIDQGTTEEAYARNRRANFVITSK
jgi:peptidoglycan-associated lipoprotein